MTKATEQEQSDFSRALQLTGNIFHPDYDFEDRYRVRREIADELAAARAEGGRIMRERCAALAESDEEPDSLAAKIRALST